MKLIRVGWYLISALLAANTAQAALFTPTNDADVVQALPYRPSPAARVQQARIQGGTLSLPQALTAARSAIDRSRRFGDPRELGLAQAALAPWWTLAEPPPEARLLRATLRQSGHDFKAALADLAVLTQPSPAVPLAVQAQALLTQATVLQVTGQLSDARERCGQLTSHRFAPLGAGVSNTGRICLAELRSLRGQPREADADLAALTNLSDPAWLSLVRAEAAERRGDGRAAAAHYQASLEADASVYARAAYADWLLQAQRPRDVLALLQTQRPGDAQARAADDTAEADALALRRVIALHQLRDPRAAAAARALQARFAEAHLRGDGTHAREESRFLLDVMAQPGAALVLAQTNWQAQKEPADALLLARCALAAGQPAALAPLREFVRATGWSDARLTALDRSLQP